MYCVAWLKDGRSQSPLGKIYWFHLLFEIKSIFIVIILLLQFLFIFVIKGLNSSKSDYGCFNLNEKIISKWTAMRCFIMKKKEFYFMLMWILVTAWWPASENEERGRKNINLSIRNCLLFSCFAFGIYGLKWQLTVTIFSNYCILIEEGYFNDLKLFVNDINKMLSLQNVKL